MHVHTSRYSSCSLIDPARMLLKAREIALNGLVITEHNFFWPASEREELRGKADGLLVLFGLELLGKKGGHYLIYGLIEPQAFRSGMDEGEMIQAAHSQGAMVVSAHPFRYSLSIGEQLYDLPLDGIEVMSANTAIRGHQEALMAQEQLGLLPLCGSDAHSLDMLGKFAMDFFEDIKDEAQFLKALRQREYCLFFGGERHC